METIMSTFNTVGLSFVAAIGLLMLGLAIL